MALILYIVFWLANSDLMNKIYLVAGLLVLAVFACVHEPTVSLLDIELRTAIGDPSTFLLPDSKDYANIPQSPVNPLSDAKVELGKMLFFEPAFGVEAKHLSGMNTFTCSSCHVPEAGFRPARMQGIADGGVGFGEKGEARIKLGEYDASEIDAQGARPLAVLNTAYVTHSMWNGSFGSGGVNAGTEHMWGVFDPGTAINQEGLGSLEGQNIEGLKTHRLLFTPELVETFGYKSYFDAAFSDFPESERYTRKTASFAISAYLRTLLCNEAPFQRWLKGEEGAMTDAEKRGATLFSGKAGCRRCHNQPNLGSITFHAIGVDDLFEHGGLKTDINDRRNLGRGGFTDEAADMYKFRVPQLYNLGDAGPYFHGASKETLEEVIQYFNDGIGENPRVPQQQLSEYFHPLNLNQQEMDDLTAFIRNGLRDPNLKRYVPEQVLSGMCFPNNDPVSKKDMDCH